MATEISCVCRDRCRPTLLDRVGGRGWCEDIATVLGQIAEGREYQVRRGAALLRVCVVHLHGQPSLSTDPGESQENHLLSLPDCR